MPLNRGPSPTKLPPHDNKRAMWQRHTGEAGTAVPLLASSAASEQLLLEDTPGTGQTELRHSRTRRTWQRARVTYRDGCGSTHLESGADAFLIRSCRWNVANATGNGQRMSIPGLRILTTWPDFDIANPVALPHAVVENGDCMKNRTRERKQTRACS